MPTVEELLSDPQHGLVREVRASQLRMASSVEEVVKNGGVYFCDAPVGVGKSFGYLVPSLLSEGKRIVIATAKKQLQDQIDKKDLPAISKALGPSMARLLTSAEGEPWRLSIVVKGKSNYACKLLADKHAPDVTYEQFLKKSLYGDRAEYPGQVPAWWGSATAEECVGRGCKHSGTCGFLRLKGEIGQSRVIVVNHHLLGSDMYYGFGKMVGGPYDVLIVDEAHKLADGVRAAFTVRVAENAISDLIDALSKTGFSFRTPKPLATVWELMFRALPNRHWREAHLRDMPVFPTHADEATKGLEAIDVELRDLLAQYGIRGDVSDPEFWAKIASAELENEDVRRDLMALGRGRKAVDALSRGLRTLQGRVKPLEDEDPEDFEARKQRILENTVAYGQQDKRGRFIVNCAPVNLGGIAKGYLGSVKSVVLTSATLAVHDNFDHLDDVVGVPATKTEILPPAFDYDRQGFVYIPKDLPNLSRQHPEYAETMERRIDRAAQLVELSQGGAFILTTANDELNLFAERLKARFPRRVFAQGDRWDGDPRTVLDRYLATPDSVLIGSKSFWEGVDVVGERLRLVIMAKLPFPIFGDPIVKAREKIAGDAAFKKVQLVDMLIDLKQGVGRLIRSRTDRGCVAILDSRVWSKKSYGGLVLKALPWSPNLVTSDLSVCEKYIPRIVSYFKRSKDVPSVQAV